MEETTQTPKINFGRIFKLLFKKIIWNKYFLLSFLFLIWMVFFDTHSLLNHYDLAQQIKNYEKEKEVLQQKLDESKEYYKKLKTDPAERERYARENYFMKRDNEDIVIVTFKEDSLKNKTTK